MTSAEAAIFFPHNANDDLDDLYEERLFEYKTFFITNFPIKKVFLAKEKKMLQMHEAYILINRCCPQLIEVPVIFKKNISDLISEAFNTFQNNKNVLKSKISNSTNAIEVSNAIRLLLEIQTNYIEKWILEGDFNTENIKYSKEPDPMEVLKSILEFNKMGGFSFDDLNSKRNILPELLWNEAKRLSLCRKLL
jgi:hypothetical protein